jgi:hypothetical protein
MRCPLNDDEQKVREMQSWGGGHGKSGAGKHLDGVVALALALDAVDTRAHLAARDDRERALGQHGLAHLRVKLVDVLAVADRRRLQASEPRRASAPRARSIIAAHRHSGAGLAAACSASPGVWGERAGLRAPHHAVAREGLLDVVAREVVLGVAGDRDIIVVNDELHLAQPTRTVSANGISARLAVRARRTGVYHQHPRPPRASASHSQPSAFPNAALLSASPL